jgi:hypothetical protein
MTHLPLCTQLEAELADRRAKVEEEGLLLDEDEEGGEPDLRMVSASGCGEVGHGWAGAAMCHAVLTQPRVLNGTPRAQPLAAAQAKGVWRVRVLGVSAGGASPEDITPTLTNLLAYDGEDRQRCCWHVCSVLVVFLLTAAWRPLVSLSLSR